MSDARLVGATAEDREAILTVHAQYLDVNTRFDWEHLQPLFSPAPEATFFNLNGHTYNRLRVFRSAHTAHLGRGVGQERWWRVGPSEKYAARCGSMWDEMRMRTACFARAPQRCTSRLSKHFLLTFQEVTPLSKTCNQLYVKTLDICRQTV